MSIFSENYLMEHGGAHRKYGDYAAKQEIKNNKDGIKKYWRDVYDTTGTTYKTSLATQLSNPNSRIRKFGVENDFPITKDNIDYAQSEARTIKNHVGAGKDNIPKNREAGTYSKLQAEKRKNLKEACEYILSILEESEYIDDYHDLYE